MTEQHNSQISGFYRLSVDDRLTHVAEYAELSIEDQQTLKQLSPLTIENANQMIENVITVYGMPMGLATNFLINGRDYLVPMVIEEPSVVAAVSYAARLARQGGGFNTSSDDPIMIGQIQVLDLDDLDSARASILSHKDQLLAQANETAGSILKRGGGAVDIDVRLFPDTAVGQMLVVHLLYDTRDAMGANAVNTAVEHLADTIADLTGGRVNLRILSNLTDRRKARASCVIPAHTLTRGDSDGRDVVQSIVEAGVFAEVDPYRATTHNKGIMNGIDAVVIATGNDWRAVEAGAHAYAVRDGSYSSLTHWWQDDDGNLRGEIELPLAVGIVGGATRVHPLAGIALRILGVKTAQELAEICAAVGLAQNFAAIRALATDGIQKGHMRMHARQLAVAAGALPDEVNTITNALIAESRIRLERAKELVEDLRKGSL